MGNKRLSSANGLFFFCLLAIISMQATYEYLAGWAGMLAGLATKIGGTTNTQTIGNFLGGAGGAKQDQKTLSGIKDKRFNTLL